MGGGRLAADRSGGSHLAAGHQVVGRRLAVGRQALGRLAEGRRAVGRLAERRAQDHLALLVRHHLGVRHQAEHRAPSDHATAHLVRGEPPVGGRLAVVRWGREAAGAGAVRFAQDEALAAAPRVRLRAHAGDPSARSSSSAGADILRLPDKNPECCEKSPATGLRRGGS
jgi:hypothetical protein